MAVSSRADTSLAPRVSVRLFIVGAAPHVDLVKRIINKELAAMSSVEIVSKREWMTIHCVVANNGNGCIVSYAVTSQGTYLNGSYNAYKLPLSAEQHQNIDKWFANEGVLVDHFIQITDSDEKLTDEIATSLLKIEADDIKPFGKVFN